MLKKIIEKYKRFARRQNRKKINKFVESYVRQNNMAELIGLVNSLSGSTGTQTHDYVVLHSYVLSRKPQYVLECGTGKTTWMLAHALKKIHKETGVHGKVISMESIKGWHEEATRIFPEELRPYAEIVYSPSTTFQYSIIKGTAYTSVPDYPYSFVFVDGPELTITDSGHSYETANMDLIRYLLKATSPVTAVVDCRLRTCVAYGTIFGQNRMQFLQPWQLGILENVTKDDMLLNVDGEELWKVVKQSAKLKFASPSWLKGKI